jgi:hypothetical protein
MKDQLIAVLEALRVSRAELMTHDGRRVKNGPRTIQRLKEVLFDDRVTLALSVLGQADEAPSVVPQHEEGDPRNERV